MSMYSTRDSENDDRMGRTESVEDTLLSPTKGPKDSKFARYSSSKFWEFNKHKKLLEYNRGCIQYTRNKNLPSWFKFLGNKSKTHRSALSHSASNLLRRSFGRLPFALTSQQSADNTVSLTPYDFKASQQPDENLDDDILETSVIL